MLMKMSIMMNIFAFLFQQFVVINNNNNNNKHNKRTTTAGKYANSSLPSFERQLK